MGNKILVVGATGNLGRPLIQLLAEKGETIKAATRKLSKHPNQPGIEFVSFDYDQPETYGPALEGVNRIVLIMGGLDITPDRMAIPLIDQAQQMGIEHIVFMSGMNVDKTDTPWFPRIEKHLLASGIAYTILRPSWFMSLFIQGLRGPQEICLPLGNAEISFIDPDDISAVTAAAITEERHRGQIYTLSGNRALSMQEGAEIITRITGVDLTYVPIAEEVVRAQYQQMGRLSAEKIEYIMLSYKAGRDGLYAIVSNDVEAVLGRPPITIEQYAARHAQAWQTGKGTK